MLRLSQLEGYKIIRDLGGPLVSRVISTGGGAKNEQWAKMRGRMLKAWLEEVGGGSGVNKDVVSQANLEGDAALGAATIALRCAKRKNLNF